MKTNLLNRWHEVSAMKTKTFRIQIYTGPTCVKEVVARINNLAGMLAARAEDGTQDAYFSIDANDQVDAYVRVQDLMAYIGLRSFATRLGCRNGVQAREINA